MQRIVNILNQKWAVAFALLPGINLAYLIFRFLVRIKPTHKVSIWMAGLVGAPFCILYHVLPDSLNWLVTHLIISAIAVLVMIKSRGGYYSELRFSKDAVFFLAIYCFMGLVLIRYLPTIDKVNRISRMTESALHAIVQDDEATWQAQFHPEHGTELMDLQAFKSSLQSSGIVITEDFRYGTGRSAASNERVAEGDAIGRDTWIVSDGVEYRVEVIYQETENGSGFIEFKIIPTRN